MDAFTYEYLLSQPVFCKVINAISDGVVIKKCEK